MSHMAKAGSRVFILIRRFSGSAAEVPKAPELAQRPLQFNEASTFVFTSTHVATLGLSLASLFVAGGGAIVFGVHYLVEKDIAGMEGKLKADARADSMAASASYALSFLNGKATFPYQVTEAVDNAKMVVEAMEKLKAAVEAMDKLKSSSEAKGSDKRLQ